MSGLDSFSAALEIRALRPHTRIALLASHALPDQLQQARRLRLNGYILKKDGSEELFYAIKTILGGGFYAPPALSNELPGSDDTACRVLQLARKIIVQFAP